ncbi:FtsK/SpoIIIE family DNA translocase [Parvibacter caecicola]|uniref:FtsK/SpoIIIE family DNA translocase n=1 Tax=Parvibacter caecicola TaxID=747645 RepID=UPI00273034C7|nr:DNA translocase FtsK [Parvibacter caecicola]
MARKTASSNAKKPATRKPSQKARAAAPASNQGPLFDQKTRTDIGGVVLIALGVILFIAAIMPTEGLVSDFAGNALRMLFGTGAYFVPLFLVAIGFTFVWRFDKQRMSIRVSLGLVIILVAVLSLCALATPIPTASYDDFFQVAALQYHGGYLGAAVAWVLCVLFGPVISAIILVALIVVGVIVIGFSLTDLLERIRAYRDARTEAREQELDQQVPEFARIRRGRDGRTLRSLDTELPMPAGQATMVVGAPAQECAARGRHSGAALKTAVLPPQNFEQSPVEQPALTRRLKKADDPAPPRKKASAKKAAPAPAPEAEASGDGFQLPSMSLLESGVGKRGGSTPEELAEVGAELQGTLEDFGVMASVVGWVEGPTVTLFKVDLPSGVRVSKVTNLTDDIALALAAPGVRIFAPIPGTNYVGIEVPNRKRQTVYLPDVLAAAGPGPLQVAIGEDVEGHSIVHDLAKMPHVLIAGTTGSGKSVEVNAMIMSILLRATPSEVRFIMIDPKRVEFAPYEGIPHLYVPVVTECREASSALSWAVAEMERRLKLFSKCGVRNIISFNEKAKAAQAADEEAQAKGEEASENPYGEPIPYIVIVIDELADLMMNVGKEVEFSISRLAQLARAAGIHLIIATQRPSTNVVTGLIKANITCRIGLTVASGIDSRVILDSTGAENLIGMGDLLISKPEYPKPVRVQGPYVPDEEIAAVVEHLKSQGEPEYHTEILSTNVMSVGDTSTMPGGGGEDDDPLLWEAAEVVVSSNLGSTSALQRRLKVGYARAGRIMDQLEEKGVVGPGNGSKPREVLVDELELETLKAFEAGDSMADEEY